MKKKEREVEGDGRKTLYQRVCHFSFGFFLFSVEGLVG